MTFIEIHNTEQDKMPGIGKMVLCEMLARLTNLTVNICSIVLLFYTVVISTACILLFDLNYVKINRNITKTGKQLISNVINVTILVDKYFFDSIIATIQDKAIMAQVLVDSK